MTNDLPVSDLLAEMMRSIISERQRRSDEHAALRASEAYQGAIRQVDRYILDYGLGINSIEAMATRNQAYFNELISLRIKPHLVQAMIAASHMIKEGLYDPARREMRFLVEASVKALWLDQGSPPLRDNESNSRELPPMTVTEKVAALDNLGRERFVQIVDSLQFRLLDSNASAQYRQTAKSLYGTLSKTIHVSSQSVAKDLANFDKGKHFSFETAADVKAIARLLRQVLDLALSSHFEAFDHELVGDLFEPPFVPRWSFLETPLVRAVDQHFDYKHERRQRRGE